MSVYVICNAVLQECVDSLSVAVALDIPLIEGDSTMLSPA